jgi:hypothetical protein
MRCPDCISTATVDEHAGLPAIHLWHDQHCPMWGRFTTERGFGPACIVQYRLGCVEAEWIFEAEKPF